MSSDPEGTTEKLIYGTYFISSFLFILSLGGLSNQETSRKGNWFGILGMVAAIVATFFTDGFADLVYLKFFIAVVIGAIIGAVMALRVEMIAMPQMVAILHSFVGLAATIVGFASFAKNEAADIENLKNIETSLGIFIGAVTFTGSVVAWGKLQGVIKSNPLIIGGSFRHWLNAGIILGALSLIIAFCFDDRNIVYLLIICGLALFLGWHLVMAIGGADMPVVVSMLNSYSGWATAASGFMLENKLLIISGALIGSSGAILSYIMCKAMNRSFFSVISGGFGLEVATGPAQVVEGEMVEANADEVSKALLEAKSVIIVPGYGMAVSRAQNNVGALAASLRKMGKTCRFCIHPVAGRLPGHMNVLLAEARVPYDIVQEMDHINKDFASTDVVIVIGANDTVNPDAMENPASPIAGMPVCEVWHSKKVFVIKRGKGKGYAAIENTLFFKPNTRMFYGNADDKIKEVMAKVGDSKPIEVVVEKASDKKEAIGQLEEENPISPPTTPFRTIGVPKEIFEGEKRIAISPSIGRKLAEKGFLVRIQEGAGVESSFSNEEYKKNGCEIVDGNEVWDSEIVLKVRPPQFDEGKGKHEAEMLGKCSYLVSYIYPAQSEELIQKLTESNPKLTVFALDCIPRITRGQKMDTISSTANLAGYRAVIEAFVHLPKFSKPQITAAGKVPPAKIFIIGAGVAGLAAIGTAGGLGCEIRAFDTRAAAREQIESLGAQFVTMDYEESGEGTGGYGKEMSNAYYEAQRKMVLKQAQEVDIIITTALIPGKPAPKLINEEAVRAMRPGSVIIDMASERGGNCVLTKPGEIYVDEESKVTLVGIYDYPSKMAKQSSELFSVNLYNFLSEVIGSHVKPENTAEHFHVNHEDEIIKGMCVIKEGEFIWKPFRPPPPQPSAAAPQKPQNVNVDLKPSLNNPSSSPNSNPKAQDGDYVRLNDPEVRQYSLLDHPLFSAMIILVLAIGLDIILAECTNQGFIRSMGVFVLAIFTGYLIIWNVAPALHTPLMAVTNAISGVILIGGMVTLIPKGGDDEFFYDYSALAFVSLLFASVNVFGGFIVTHRMLEMFKKNE